MPNDLEVLNSKLLALHAQTALAVGVVQHPDASQLDYLGIPVRPGMQMVDQVTGQIVEVIHGGVESIDPSIAIEGASQVGGGQTS